MDAYEFQITKNTDATTIKAEIAAASIPDAVKAYLSAAVDRQAAVGMTQFQCNCVGSESPADANDNARVSARI